MTCIRVHPERLTRARGRAELNALALPEQRSAASEPPSEELHE